MALDNKGTKDMPLILLQKTEDGWQEVMSGTGTEIFQIQFKGLRGTLKNALKNSKGEYRVIKQGTGKSPYQDI